jgi:hypothetical protein
MDWRMPMSAFERVPLRVETEDPESEIFLVDGKFRLRAKGLGTLRESMSPGLYKVKVHTGSRIRERYVMLKPGNETLVGKTSDVTLSRSAEEVVMHFAPIPFTTAVPLNGVSWQCPEHTTAAIRHSTQVHVSMGQGSQLFVFNRSWTQEEASPGERQREVGPPVKITLHDHEGDLLVDLFEEGAVDAEAKDPWMACNIELNPGFYRLRVRTGAGPELEGMLVAAKGWQTQVFMCQVRKRGAKAAALSPGTGSVHLRRIDERGFNPYRPGMRVTELARIGLANERAVLSPALLHQLREMELRNPMLGLYGAYLLLLDNKPDLELVRGLVHSLRGQLGSHPDVEALALRAGLEPIEPEIFQWPPMLMRSWSIIVNETIGRPNLVPQYSLASMVADRLWGNGPWTMWKAPSALSPFRKRRSQKAGSMADPATLVRCLRDVPPQSFKLLRDLSPVERALTGYLVSSQAHGEEDPESFHSESQEHAAQEPIAEQLVQSFGVPLATLQEALILLCDKLNELARSLGREEDDLRQPAAAAERFVRPEVKQAEVKEAPAPYASARVLRY